MDWRTGTVGSLGSIWKRPIQILETIDVTTNTREHVSLIGSAKMLAQFGDLGPRPGRT